MEFTFFIVAIVFSLVGNRGLFGFTSARGKLPNADFTFLLMSAVIL